MTSHYYYKTDCEVVFYNEGDSTFVKITGPDVFDRKLYSVTILKAEFDAIESGEHFQDAIGSVSKQEREFLISGLSPSTFPKKSDLDNISELPPARKTTRSVNKAFLIGHVGKDPELSFTPSELAVCNFSVATTERFRDKAGERQERTEWHNIVAWSGLAHFCCESLTKGSHVYIEGRLVSRSYDDRNGHQRYVTEVVANNIKEL